MRLGGSRRTPRASFHVQPERVTQAEIEYSNKRDVGNHQALTMKEKCGGTISSLPHANVAPERATKLVSGSADCAAKTTEFEALSA